MREQSPGEWLEEKNEWGGVRRYRWNGLVKEYEGTVVIGGVAVPESQVEIHNERMKAQAEKRMEADWEKSQTVKTGKICPFKQARNRQEISCQADCALYGEGACVLMSTSSDPSEGKDCILMMGKCQLSCAMYSGGCGLIQTIKNLMG